MNLKFVKIEIFNNNEKLIREIKFTPTFFVIGDVLEAKSKGTSNALGKTTLVNIISYMLCGNMNKSLSNLRDYSIMLDILMDEKEYFIYRKIGSTTININGVDRTLDEAKIILDINRNILNHLIHMTERKNAITDEPNKYELYKEAYKILGLDVNDEAEKIYNLYQEKIRLEDRLNFLDKELEKEDLYNVKDAIEQKQKELAKIQNLDESEIQLQTQRFHNEREQRIEYKKTLMSKKAYNKNRILEIDNYVRNIGVSDNDIISFYDKVNSELSQFIHLKVDGVIEFHHEQNIERSKYLISEKEKLLKENDKISEEIQDIEVSLPRLKQLIDENNEIKHLFEIQNTLVNEISQLSLKNTYFDELKMLESNLDDIKIHKLEVWNELRKKQIDEIKERYRLYSKELVTRFYPESYKSYFDIKVVESNNINKVAYPISFIFEISKDNSEGVRNTRNLIVDLIMFKFSDLVSYMIWDSSVFNGIDPNQLKELIKEIIDISKSSNKQAILFLNRFQLGDYYNDIIQMISDSDVILLSDKNTLLLEDF